MAATADPAASAPVTDIYLLISHLSFSSSIYLFYILYSLLYQFIYQYIFSSFYFIQYFYLSPTFSSF